MAIRFFAAAVASMGLVSGAFAQSSTTPMPAPMPMSGTVMESATMVPATTPVRRGLFARRAARHEAMMVPTTVMPATGVVTASAQTVTPMPMTTPTPMPMAGTPMPTGSTTTTMTTTAPMMTVEPIATPARPRLFGRLFARRMYS